MEPVDRIAHALAAVQPLSTPFHIAPAALEQPDPDVGATQLVGDADPGRPCPHDADIGLNFLAAR